MTEDQQSTLTTGFGHCRIESNQPSQTLSQHTKTGRERIIMKREAHRAAISSSSVRLKEHVVVHRGHSVIVHENLRAGRGCLNANNLIARCHRLTQMIGADQPPTFPTGFAQLPQRIKSTPSTPFKAYSTRRGRNAFGRQAYRAAPSKPQNQASNIKPTLANPITPTLAKPIKPTLAKPKYRDRKLNSNVEWEAHRAAP